MSDDDSTLTQKSFYVDVKQKLQLLSFPHWYHRLFKMHFYIRMGGLFESKHLARTFLKAENFIIAWLEETELGSLTCEFCQLNGLKTLWSLWRVLWKCSVATTLKIVGIWLRSYNWTITPLIAYHKTSKTRPAGLISKISPPLKFATIILKGSQVGLNSKRIPSRK